MRPPAATTARRAGPATGPALGAAAQLGVAQLMRQAPAKLVARDAEGADHVVAGTTGVLSIGTDVDVTTGTAITALM